MMTLSKGYNRLLLAPNEPVTMVIDFTVHLLTGTG